MNPYRISIHTQQGTITYNVMVPEFDENHRPVNVLDLLMQDEPVALDTAEGGAIIIQAINAVAIEVEEENTPPGQKS